MSGYESWATHLSALSHDERVLTFCEDGSTLDEFVLEGRLLQDACRRALAAFDQRFPKKQSKELPGIELWAAMSLVRKVLEEGVRDELAYPSPPIDGSVRSTG